MMLAARGGHWNWSHLRLTMLELNSESVISNEICLLITLANHGQDTGKVLILTKGKSSGSVADSCPSGFLEDNKWKKNTAWPETWSAHKKHGHFCSIWCLSLQGSRCTSPILKSSLGCHLLVYTERVKRERLNLKLVSLLLYFIIMVLCWKIGIFKGYFKFICVQQSFWNWSPQSTCMNSCQNERTTKLLQLQTEGELGWGLWAAPAPSSSSAGAMPGPAAPGPCLPWLWAVRAGELALAGSHTPAQLLHPRDRRGNRRKSKKTHWLDYR